MDLDNSRGESPTTSDQNAQINWAYRIIARKCMLATDTPLYLAAGTNVYSLRDVTTPTVGAKIIRPVLVYINANGTSFPLYDASYRDYGLWSYDELARLRPTWKNDSQGPPTKAVWYSHDKLLLHPAPDASTAARTGHAVFGTYLPLDLALDSDTPALPEEIHEAVGWLAAQLAATPMATEQEAWQRLEKYSEYWSQIIQEVADQNERTLQAWGSTKGYYEDELMIS